MARTEEVMRHDHAGLAPPHDHLVEREYAEPEDDEPLSPTFHGWRSPIIGLIVAVLAYAAYRFYHRFLVGDVWLDQRLNQLDEAWGWVIVTIVVLAAVVFLLRGLTNGRTRDTWPLALGVAAWVILILAIILAATPVGATGSKGSGDEGDNQSRIEELIAKRSDEATDQGLKPGPSTSGGVECVDGCIFEDGLVGKTPEGKFKDMQRKILRSPAAAEGFARAIREAQGKKYELKSKGDRRFSDNLYINFGFYLDADVRGGVLPKGTRVLNTTLRNGVVSQFEYTLKKDREFIVITKDGVELLVFTSCSNFVTPIDRPVPGVPKVKPPKEQPCRVNCNPQPPRRDKCKNADGSLYDPDGDGKCGTSGSGPDLQPPQEGNGDLDDPSSGCTGNNCMDDIADSQEDADPDSPSDFGSDSGCQGCNEDNPGTDNGQEGEVGGTPQPGTDDGVDHPGGDPGGF